MPKRMPEGLLNKLQKLRTQLHNSKRHYYYANFNGYPFPAVRKETDFHHKKQADPSPSKTVFSRNRYSSIPVYPH
jgi:hypothetical protein